MARKEAATSNGSLAQVSALVTTALVTVSTRYGFGRHIELIVDSKVRSEAIKYTLIAPAISLFASGFAKISVVLFLKRILGAASSVWHGRVLNACTGIMICVNIFAVVIIVFYCYPVSGSWDPTVHAKCMEPAILDVGGRAVAGE